YIFKDKKLVAKKIVVIREEYHDIIVGMPEIDGVQALELSNYIIRVRADTLPVMQWEGARISRKEVKEKLFALGIEIPSPRMVVYAQDNTKEKEVYIYFPKKKR